MPVAELNASSSPAARRIAWRQPASGFVGLSLFNALLRILTLGIYHFWAKTEVRQHIWSAVRIDGEPLEYRGTGGELFRAFVAVVFLVLLPLGTAGLLLPHLLGPASPVRGLYISILCAVLFLLVGAGIHRARRYRLSRTRWRAIAGGVSGAAAPFAWTYLWTTALVPLTLGWILPWRRVRLHRALLRQTCFGDTAFVFTGTAGPLYRRFGPAWLAGAVLVLVTGWLVALLLFTPMESSDPSQGEAWQRLGLLVALLYAALFLLALIRAWYAAGALAHLAAHTTFQGARFRLDATAGGLIWLAATNFLMRTLSLGVLAPVAAARSARYIVERLTLDGTVAWDRVGHSRDASPGVGEGP